MYSILTILFLLFPQENQIKINDPWVRPSSEKMATALYFTIENSGSFDDTLFAVSSDIAEKVELHETYSDGDMMGMRKTEMIVIGAGSSFELKPGGYHIMLMKLKKDINAGDEVEVLLHFKVAGEINILAVARKPS